MARTRTMPTIYTASPWTSGAWTEDKQLRLPGRLELGIGSDQRDQVEFHHRYGPHVKRADQTEMQQADPLAYRNRWVRIVEPDAGTILWQGMIKIDRRTILRSSEGPHGMQRLIAIGPIEILRRITINTSRWWNATYKRYYELDWVPSINARGPDGRLQGTKGGYDVGDKAGYGVDATDSIWTWSEYVEYLLRFYVQQTGGPEWKLVDKTGTLAQRIDPVKMNSAQTALAVLRRLVQPSEGLEFAIIPTDAGYTITVFALSTQAVTFGTATFPANTDTLEINPTTDDRIIDAEAEISELQTHDVLEVQGERIESCFTIAAAEKRALWTAAQEAAYKAGSSKGSPTTADHDLARTDDRLRLVYQGHAADTTFDWNSGEATVVLDDYGDFYDTNAERQNSMRATLTKLPLREGGDYTTDPPDEDNATEDYIPPMAIGYVSASRGYVLLDKIDQADLETDDSLLVRGAAIHVLESDWGLLVKFPANYMHAAGHWASGSPADTGAFGITDPDTQCIDYDDTSLTIAAKTDKRLKCVKARSSPAGDGSKMVLEVPGALMQYLSGSTHIGVNANGNILFAPSAGVVLRNDNESLHMIVAGAIASYLQERFALTVDWHGIEPGPGHLGKVMVMGADEGDLAGKAGLVTSVWFEFEQGKSGLRAGYA